MHKFVCFYKLNGLLWIHRCSLKAGKCLFIMKIAEFTWSAGLYGWMTLQTTVLPWGTIILQYERNFIFAFEDVHFKCWTVNSMALNQISSCMYKLITYSSEVMCCWKMLDRVIFTSKLFQQGEGPTVPATGQPAQQSQKQQLPSSVAPAPHSHQFAPNQQSSQPPPSLMGMQQGMQTLHICCLVN